MAVITISIEESSEQIVAGFPKTITITTNVPATIFFTLDGSVPTVFSTIYTGPIFLPSDKLTVVLNTFASNGTDSSPIITETYITDMVSSNARLPHSGTDAAAGSVIPDLYPFGTNADQPSGRFLNPADAGITINNPAKSEISSGFDGSGAPNAFTNDPFDLEHYSVQYSTTDAEGNTGIGIGTLPATVKIQLETPIPEQSEQFSNLFDPRAFVIFQDFSKEDPNDPPQINRASFTLENGERARDGNYYFNSGLDAPPTSGTFVRSAFNPRNNTMTYYYIDTWTNRWVISTQPFVPDPNVGSNLSGVVGGRGPGSNRVFEWIPFQRRVLF